MLKEENNPVEHHQHSLAAGVGTETVLSSREAAIKAGARRYLSGEPCPAGHVAERYTLNGYCVECQREKNQADRSRARANMGAAR